MMKAMTLTALMALTILTGCDSASRDMRRERESRAYLSAMSDYQAGRLPEAIKGLMKVTADEPANASARFQLACLLQDHAKDYVGAFCAFREYLQQQPQSDKSALARDRLAKCEVELAKLLADRHRLLDTGAAERIAELQKSLKDAEERNVLYEKQLTDIRGRVEALSAERDRMLKVVKGTGVENVTGPMQTGFKEAKDLLEEEDESVGGAQPDKDIAALKNEEAEELSSGSTILAPRKPEDLARRKALQDAEAERRRREAEAREARRHPETYVVQEGDTLYRIAVRFYGRMSAWKAIRDANKATISSDGRLLAGQVIRLPEIAPK